MSSVWFVGREEESLECVTAIEEWGVCACVHVFRACNYTCEVGSSQPSQHSWAAVLLTVVEALSVFTLIQPPSEEYWTQLNPAFFSFSPLRFLSFYRAAMMMFKTFLTSLFSTGEGGQDGGFVRIECVCASWSLILWIKAVELSLKWAKHRGLRALLRTIIQQ